MSPDDDSPDAMDQGEHILTYGGFGGEQWECSCSATGDAGTFIQHTIESDTK